MYIRIATILKRFLLNIYKQHSWIEFSEIVSIVVLLTDISQNCSERCGYALK